jgi:hypothetical protein
VTRTTLGLDADEHEAQPAVVGPPAQGHGALHHFMARSSRTFFHRPRVTDRPLAHAPALAG